MSIHGFHPPSDPVWPTPRAACYWRSLGELADTPEFRDYLHREFPEQASEWNDPKGRREFLKLMSASLALAGVGACTKQPPEGIVPYVRQPEDIIPGRPLFFASAIPDQRRRASGPGRKPYGATDQNRRKPGSPGQPRRHRCPDAGRRPRSLRSRPRADPDLPRRGAAVGQLPDGRADRRSRPAARGRGPGCGF